MLQTVRTVRYHSQKHGVKDNTAPSETFNNTHYTIWARVTGRIIPLSTGDTLPKNPMLLC